MKRFILMLLLLLFITVYGLCPSPLRSVLVNNAVDTALFYEGIRETKYNSSPVINKFIYEGRGSPGQSWCMYYVYYCYNQAAKFLKIKNPLLKTGSCSAQLKYANCFGSGLKVISTKGFGRFKILRGDIPIFKHGIGNERDIGKIFKAHTGINLKQKNSNTVVLIEGNTNKAGSREGDGVYIKERYIYKKGFKILAFIRI